MLGPGPDHADLPRYQWSRERHWFESRPAGVGVGVVEDSTGHADHPLLGRRISAAAPLWQVDLGAPGLGWLRDHIIQGVAIHPAAAYAEAVLSAARLLGEEAPAVRDLTLPRALLYGDGPGRRVQYSMADGVVAVHSSADGAADGWELHAKGRPGAAGPRPDPVDRDAIRARCPVSIDADELYEGFRDRGAYGDAFRGIATAWQGPGEAVGMVALPDVVTGVDGYLAHPALLDAAFQMVLAAAQAMGGGDTQLYIPLRIDKVAVWEALGRSCWVHARVVDGDRGRGRGRRASGGGRGGGLFRRGRAGPADGRRAAVPADRRAGRLDRDRRRLAVRAAVGGGGRRGRPVGAGGRAGGGVGAGGRLRRRGGGRAGVGRLLPRRRAGVGGGRRPASPGGPWWRRAGTRRPGRGRRPTWTGPPGRSPAVAGCCRPWSAGWSRQAGCGGRTGCCRRPARPRRLGRRRRPRCSTSWPSAFPPSPPTPPCSAGAARDWRPSSRAGSTGPRCSSPTRAAELLAHFYRDAPASRFSNTLVTEVVGALAAGRRDRPLRVLEVGGGTGGTTAHVRAVLPEGSEYTFTDVSPRFTQAMTRRPHGRRRRGAGPRGPGHRSGRLRPGDRGQRGPRHGRRGARRWPGWRPPSPPAGGWCWSRSPGPSGGWTSSSASPTAGGGSPTSTPGPTHPLLTPDGWRAVLEAAGYTDVTVVADHPPDGPPGQSVLVATWPGTSALAPAAAGDRTRWAVSGDGPGGRRRSGPPWRRRAPSPRPDALGDADGLVHVAADPDEGRPTFSTASSPASPRCSA